MVAARVVAAAEAEEAISTSCGNLDANPRAISADLGAISSAISRGYDGRGRLGRRVDAGGLTSQRDARAGGVTGQRDARTGEFDGSAFATGVQLFTRPASAGCPPSSSAGYHPSSPPAWVYLGAARLSLRPHGPTVEVR